MSKILMITPKECIDCKTCEAVCPNSAVNVISFEEVEISVPVMCMQCEDAACMQVCPEDAISRDENGAVLPDPDKCIGCKLCISACPMGNIHFSNREKRIMKCDLCGGRPSCVKYCPTRAIEFIEGTTENINKKKIIASKFIELFDSAQA